MARPRTVSDEQILEATRRLIRAGGPQVPVEAIAAEIGVSGQAVLRRFGSRNRLVVEAFGPPPMQDLLTAVQNGPDQRPLADQLTDLARDLAGLLATQAQDFAILRWTPADIKDSLVSPGTDPPPLVAVRSVTAWLERSAEQGLVRTDIDLESAALAFLGALQVRAILHFVIGRSPGQADDETYIASVVDLFSRAIGKPGTKQP